MNNKMRLTPRDLSVLKTLNKLRVLDVEIIYQLCGFPRYNKCADRLAILEKNGYIKYERFYGSIKKFYTLTQKGMNVVSPIELKVSEKGKKYYFQRKPPIVKVATIEHEKTIATCLLHILKCDDSLHPDDFLSDREMKMSLDYTSRIKTKHFCDLLCEKYHTKIEIELSPKELKKLEKNFIFNGDDYVQLWIVGDNVVYKRLNDLKKRFPTYTVKVFKLDEFYKTQINLKEWEKEIVQNNIEMQKDKEHLEYLMKKKQAEQMSMYDDEFDENVLEVNKD